MTLLTKKRNNNIVYECIGAMFLFVFSFTSAVETGFVISHRVAMIFPTPNDIITDKDNNVNFTFEVYNVIEQALNCTY